MCSSVKLQLVLSGAMSRAGGCCPNFLGENSQILSSQQSEGGLGPCSHTEACTPESNLLGTHTSPAKGSGQVGPAWARQRGNMDLRDNGGEPQWST